MTAETPSSRKPRSGPSYETYGSRASHAALPALPVRRSLGEGGFAESAKLEHVSADALAKVEAIKANLRGLGFK